jgi:hypothetical protein
MQATACKEEIQLAIEAQQEMETDDQLEDDQYLAEVNLKDLESTSGEHHEYWLILICAAQEVSILQERRQSNSRSQNITGIEHMHG